MAKLSLHLLGTFQAEMDGRPLEEFRSNKVRALLAYLVMERDRRHLRTHLAGLLWPDWPEPAARTYLRQAVANLRTLLCDRGVASPFLLVTRKAIQFNPSSDLWLDADCLSGDGRLPILPTDDDIARLEDAVALYRGSFLEGFYLEGCPSFDEWQLMARERIRRQMETLCSQLAQWHEARVDLPSAVKYSRHGVELDPLWEEAQYRLIRLLAKQGEPAAALAHYEHFRSLLAEELGIDPAPNTIALASRIRAGATTQKDSGLPLGPSSAVTSGREVAEPPFIVLRPVAVQPQPFADRVEALQELGEQLDAALLGQGRIVFVAGEAGQGKSMLVQHFARRAMERHPNLVTAGGSSGGSGDLGDPYLSFRELLAQLTGDFEAQWRAGAISRDHARRLWALLPQAVDALLVHGPDLLDKLVPASLLAHRLEAASAATHWQSRLREVVDSTPPLAATRRSQIALFDQCTRFLHAVSRFHPLLLWLDDLQWADASSLALLLHLGQRLEGFPIFVVGAYRPEEVGSLAEGRPLERVVGELRNHHGTVVVDLDRASGRDFVRAYLETMRHRLDRTFEETLCRLGDGHALFTVELVRHMQDQGFLVHDANGCWVASPKLEWEFLPARVEAVIGQRVERLSEALRQVLDVAAVEGEHFTAEVVAAVLHRDAAEIIHSLSALLDRRYRLVSATGIEIIEERRLSRYRFRHVLFQKYIHGMLDPAQSAQLHEKVGRSLEYVYAGQTELLAQQAGRLAWHFEQAGLSERAVTYYEQAGNHALRLAAYDEALTRYQRGLDLAAGITEPSRRDELQLDLLLGMGTVQAALQGDAAPDVEATFTRARDLCRPTPDVHKYVQVLWHLWHLHFQRGEYRTALPLAEACVEASARVSDRTLRLVTCNAIGATLYRLGEFAEADEHLSASMALCRTTMPSSAGQAYSVEPGVHCLVNASLVAWYLGYPARAHAVLQEGFKRARDVNRPFTLAFAHIFGAALGQRSSDVDMTVHHATEANRLCRQWGFALFAGVSSLYYGWALVAQGDGRSGLHEAEEGLDAVRATGMQHVRYGAVLADIYLRCGKPHEGLESVKDLLNWVARSEEREWEAELYRLRGELRLQLTQHVADQLSDAAEQDFLTAVEVAHRQQARILELRSMTSLCRLWQAQGKSATATKRLSCLYDQFAEGFDTPDLEEARALLRDLYAVPS